MSVYSSFESSANGERRIEEGDCSSFYVPSGHRFVPTDSELVEHYLLNKILRRKLPCDIINYVESLYNHDPTQLPISQFTYGRENEAYFFTHVDSASGAEQIKTTENGYWKNSDGADHAIYCDNQIIGFKKRYVFHPKNEAQGEKAYWMLQEYRINPHIILPHQLSDVTRADITCVVCKLEYRNKNHEPEDSDFIQVVEEEEEEESEENASCVKEKRLLYK